MLRSTAVGLTTRSSTKNQSLTVKMLPLILFAPHTDPGGIM
jgi:hypothetical protein